MKKPRKDGAYVRVMVRGAKKRANRQIRHKLKKMRENMRLQGKNRLLAKQSPRQPREDIKLPERFSLADNYTGVVEQINRIRNVGDKRLNINFNHIRHVGASAALMLAAELEVIKITNNSKYTANDHRWDPNVRHQLKSMGLFDLLKVKHQTIKVGDEPLDEVFVRFFSDFDKLDGDGIKEVINNTDNTAARFRAGKISEPLRRKLYEGIAEAATNTKDHAYTETADEDQTARWWISASVNKTSGEIRVICYDRGLTIPGTILASHEKMDKARAFIKGEITDRSIIKAAMLESRSSTKKSYRGHGLKALLRLIDYNGQGELEIYSRHGMSGYEKSAQFPDGHFTTRALRRELHGTLIIWDIIPSTLED